MSKSLAFIQNTTAQTITGGGVINPGTSVHGFGRTCCTYDISVSGNNISLRDRGCGYFPILASVNVSATAAGNVTISVYQDGALIAQGSETIAAANDPANIAIVTGAKVNCSSTITFVASSTAGDPIVNSIYIDVFKA